MLWTLVESITGFSTLNERLSKLRDKMRDRELDAFLVSQPENRRYLSGFTGSAGYLL
ncbi:MAG: aminopeptidase P family N-terminal domain-containing protein, partial [Chloroflexi bacterium]|nr:aminopeptidase P family N-terminal domain-containing protein [Chloroflexota bacterium]